MRANNDWWSFNVLIIGESDSGPGASAPDESVPGQTHDHPHRRNVTQRWTVPERQHSPLPHPAELFQRDPRCGGELSASTWVCVDTSSISTSYLCTRVPSGRGLCFQSEHQRCVCAEVPEGFVYVAGSWGQRWGDGGRQVCGGLPGWQCQRSVRGQWARWVSSEDRYRLLCVFIGFDWGWRC